MPVATAQAAQKLRAPNDHTLIMIGHQFNTSEGD